MVDFTSILSKKAAEVEKPKPLPTGTYEVVGQGVPDQRSVTAQGVERAVLAFKFKIASARDGVDMEKLADWGDLAAAAPMTNDIWVDTPQGEWQLRQFLENTCGISPGTEDDPRSLGEMAADYPGVRYLVTIGHRPYTDKAGQPQIGTQVTATAAL